MYIHKYTKAISIQKILSNRNSKINSLLIMKIPTMLQIAIKEPACDLKKTRHIQVYHKYYTIHDHKV